MSTLLKNISNYFKTLWFKIKLKSRQLFSEFKPFAKILLDKLKSYLIRLKEEPITKREKLIAAVIIIYAISKIF